MGEAQKFKMVEDNLRSKYLIQISVKERLLHGRIFALLPHKLLPLLKSCEVAIMLVVGDGYMYACT